jgi:glycosyltransferase involved in cell wall biosynthesis
MMNDLMVSVSMIIYKHEAYIKEAIEGVLMQETNFEFDLILADDCSPDKTPDIINEIIKNHPKGFRIKYFRHKKNIGMQPNGIFACKNCTGKYIAICEGDDYWTDPLKLQKQVDFLEANPDYVLCFHPINILKTDGSIVDDFITKVPENYETQETLARLGNYIHTPSVVFRNVIKNFPFEFELSPVGDYFLYMLLAEHGKLKCIEEKMGVYRYGVGIHSTNSQFKRVKANFKMFSLMLSNFNNPFINKILLGRQLNELEDFENLVRSEYSDAFVSHHIFFKALKLIKHPRKFLTRLKTN